MSADGSHRLPSSVGASFLPLGLLISPTAFMNQDEPIREPCPHCGEPAALSGRVCPHCRGNLLVDVVLEQPVRDSRRRYQLARSISRLGSASFLDLQTGLAAPRPIVLKGVTRHAAKSALEILRQSGIVGISKPSSPERQSSSRARVVAGMVAAVAAAAAGTWLLTSPPSETPASRPAASAEALSTQQIAERVTPSIVSLSCGQSVGSGFFVTEEQLLTNAHVLCSGNERLQVHFSDGSQMAGEVIDRDEDHDLALVRVAGATAEPLALGDAADLRAGEEVVIIGTPLGMSYTVHEGIVSHAARNLFGVAYIQVDANINPGNSGGPLIDKHGKVVGVISMQVQGASGLGFALPINYAFRDGLGFVEELEEDPSRWGEILRQIDEAEQRDIAEAERAFIQPGVAQAMVETGNVLLVVILRRSTFPPYPGEEIPFSVMKDEMTVCSGTMPISSWAPFDRALDAAPDGSSSLPQFTWLRKNGLTRDLYWGAAYFSEEDCRHQESLAGSELVLLGGDPSFNRATIVQR